MITQPHNEQTPVGAAPVPLASPADSAGVATVPDPEQAACKLFYRAARQPPGRAELARIGGTGRVLPDLLPEGDRPRFGEHFTVYVTSRKPGLAPGTTMADIAADYAAAIGEEFGGPVAFHGTSASGAVGLQLAIGYPQLVRRLVLAAAACRQSPSGRHLLAEVARLAMARDSRRASALVAQALGPRLVRNPAGALAWLVNPFVAGNPADRLTTNAAMLAFDAEPGPPQGAGTCHGAGRQRRPLLLRGPLPAHRCSHPWRTGRDLPRQRPSVPAASKAAANIALGFLLGRWPRSTPPAAAEERTVTNECGSGFPADGPDRWWPSALVVGHPSVRRCDCVQES
jgi:pimeloyl-ACP methyl ester carboxylesterase